MTAVAGPRQYAQPLGRLWPHIVAVFAAALGLDETTPFQVHDLLSESRLLWRGSRNFVQLEPGILPAHVFFLRRHIRREQDFDYFM